MPPELTVYGPIITSDGSTRVIRYTVEVSTTAPLEYTSEDDGTFSEAGTITGAPALSVAALMLQYGTKASNLPASAAVTTSLFDDEINEVEDGGSKALTGPSFVIIPLQTGDIREQLTTVLLGKGTNPLMWIENNTGETTLNTWGAGTYAQNGIRIGGLNSAGSSSSTVADFDDGDAAKNHPRSLATVLYTGKTSTINFYSPGSIVDIAIVNAAGSLQATSGAYVKNWLENKTKPPTPPAVSVIYTWK
ncbi:MAG: hypothetical protein LBK66_14715 [Spirochaetaceae bacterium]|jgi:hypothetical protein|nr:hypothetical protein [Spirochaetaceae bacterium]